MFRENRQTYFGYKTQTAEDFNNVRRDTCRKFRKKKRNYMKAKVNKLEENSKNKNIREM